MLGMKKCFLVVWALCLFPFLGISTAQATVDVGYEAYLVALVGEPADYAVFADLDVGGEGECWALHLVKLRAEAFERLHTGECPDHEAWHAGLQESHIRKFLPAEFATTEIRLGPFQEIQSFEFDWREFGPPTSPDGLPRLSVHLRVNSQVPSMATHEVHSGEPCVLDGEYLCNGCRESSRTLDGETFTTHICGPPSEDCNCTATANILRFVVVDEERGQRFLGNRLFISPNRLLQVAMSEPGQPDNMDLVMPSLKALEIDDLILIWGSAGHAPTQNGSWFPVMATVVRGENKEESVSLPPLLRSPLWWLNILQSPPEF